MLFNNIRDLISITNDLVSVIVSIYNVADELDECIESLIKQDYSNLQIILVNDGSTDKSLELCKKWEAFDRRIEVINKENGGLSDARNCGLKRANGEWVAMVDGDDFVMPNYISKLVDTANKFNVMLVNCGSKRITNNKIVDQPACSKTIKIKSREFWKLYYKSDKYRGNYQAAWSKLYKKKIFDNGIHYTKGILHEDIDILYDLINSVEEIVIIPDTLYCYRQRSGSITDKLRTEHLVDYTNLKISNRLFYNFFKNKRYELSKYALEDSINLFKYNIYASNLKRTDYKKLLRVKRTILVNYHKLTDKNIKLKLTSFLKLELFNFWFILSKIKGWLQQVVKKLS